MLQEQDNFQFITEGVQPVNDGNNRIYYAEVYEYFSKEAFRNFSIKFPLQGRVRYETERGGYDLRHGSFLLSHKQWGKKIIESPSIVRNISIDIKEQTIQEAFTVMQQQRNIDLDNLEAGYFFSPDFFENSYPVKGNKVGIELVKLAADLMQDNLQLTDETFLSLAEHVVQYELGHYKALAGLQCTRASTKREILKRLLKSRDFMDEHYLQNPPIAKVAKHSQLTEFYFFRCFKEAFGITPHKYMMRKRLEHAKQIIKAGKSFRETAVYCGFPDLFTFSKAFKRSYGFAPSIFKKGLAEEMAV